MSRTKNNYYNIVSEPLYCSTKFACNFTLIFPIILVMILTHRLQKMNREDLADIIYDKNIFNQLHYKHTPFKREFTLPY